MFRYLLFLLLTFSSFYASAVDYYWSYYEGTSTGICMSCKYQSPEAACAAYYDANSTIKQGYTLSKHSASLNGYPSYFCTFKVTSTTSHNTVIARWGDSCPAGTSYDSSVEQCRNQCLDKPPMPFSKSGTAPDEYVTISTINGKPYANKAQEGCFSGCVASTTDQKCTVKTSGLYTCKGTAYFSGQSCTSGPADLSNSPDANYPEPQTLNEEKPCAYTTLPDGSQQCTSEKSTEKEGQLCGTVNGNQVCVDKQPTKNGVQIATNVTTVTNPDGSKTTIKKDAATTTSCTAIKSCTTKTTTVTTTVKTDANGNVTSTTGSCSGANCPDSNTDPDGNGDGFGDCVGGQCGEDEGEGGDLQTPELGEVDGYQATTQKFFDKVKQSPLATSVGSISAPTSGSRPDFTTDGIAFLGGVSLDFGVIGTIWEDVKHVLSLTMRAVWCFIAIVIFFSA